MKGSIDGINPSYAPVGEIISITGKGFTGAEGVYFGGKQAEFTLKADDCVEAMVPVGARSGAIRVVLPHSMVKSHDAFVVVGEDGKMQWVSPTSNTVAAHKNVEKVIRYYLIFLPPRGVESILDIGAGVTAPYAGMLKTRCKRYAALDIRPSPLGRIDYVVDLCDGAPFTDGEWEWGWCIETMEHIPADKKLAVAREIMRICRNCVFTYPTPPHPSFDLDPGHIEVKINWQAEFGERFDVLDKTTSGGRAIFRLTEKAVA